jgi:hypothetical protein
LQEKQGLEAVIKQVGRDGEMEEKRHKETRETETEIRNQFEDACVLLFLSLYIPGTVRVHMWMGADVVFLVCSCGSS